MFEFSEKRGDGGEGLGVCLQSLFSLEGRLHFWGAEREGESPFPEEEREIGGQLAEEV